MSQASEDQYNTKMFISLVLKPIKQPAAESSFFAFDTAGFLNGQPYFCKAVSHLRLSFSWLQGEIELWETLTDILNAAEKKYLGKPIS